MELGHKQRKAVQDSPKSLPLLSILSWTPKECSKKPLNTKGDGSGWSSPLFALGGWVERAGETMLKTPRTRQIWAMGLQEEETGQKQANMASLQGNQGEQLLRNLPEDEIAQKKHQSSRDSRLRTQGRKGQGLSMKLSPPHLKWWRRSLGWFLEWEGGRCDFSAFFIGFILSNSQSAIAQHWNPMFHAHMKHIEIHPLFCQSVVSCPHKTHWDTLSLLQSVASCKGD